MDDKKIEEAAVKSTNYLKGICDFTVINASKEGFRKGARWAIHEFLKDLWHPTSEEPNNMDDKLLIEFEDCHRLTTRISLYRTVDWQYFIEKAKITRWLYIDDLFSTEGGDK